jgi:hypothetical protein
MRISVQLRCPEDSPGLISLGDVDPTDDVYKGMTDSGPDYPQRYDPNIHTTEWLAGQKAEELEDLLAGCDKVIRIGCDSDVQP